MFYCIARSVEATIIHLIIARERENDPSYFDCESAVLNFKREDRTL